VHIGSVGVEDAGYLYAQVVLSVVVKKECFRAAFSFANPVTLLWLLGLCVMVIASLLPRAGLSELETGFGRDKVARVITFLLLSFYPAAFFPSIRMGLITSTFMAPLGFLLEVFQKYVPGRNFSPEDMIANNIGAILGIALALAIRFFFRTGGIKLGKKNGYTPRAALSSEEDLHRVQDEGVKVDPGHGTSRAAEEPSRPSIFKKWRSKMMILGLLLVLLSFHHTSSPIASA